jgi:hypothetical protein
MQETVGAVTRQILSPVVIEGLFLMAVGAVMVVIALYLSNRAKTVMPGK